MYYLSIIIIIYNIYIAVIISNFKRPDDCIVTYIKHKYVYQYNIIILSHENVFRLQNIRSFMRKQ